MRIIVLSIIGFFSLWAGWKEEIIYSGKERPIYLTLGKGRNDDTVRIYWTSDDSLLREITYRNGKWNIDTVGPGIGPIVIAPARNDGRNRVYTLRENFLYEYTWDRGKWRREDWDVPYEIQSLVSGKLRSDDTMRLYFVSGSKYPKYLYESSFDSHKWNSILIDSAPYGFGALAVKIGRNDDAFRIYSEIPSACVTSVYEITFSPERWRKEEYHFGPDNWTASYYVSGGLFVGDGRGDGINRIYEGGSFGMCGVEDAWIAEYTWVESTWVFTSAVYAWAEDAGGAHPNIGAISIGKGRGDDTVRVYAHIFGYGADPPGLHEFTYYPQGWKEEIVVPQGVKFICFGKTRHNDTNHLYGIIGNSIVEFVWSPKGVEERRDKTQATRLQVNPNPAIKEVSIRYYVENSELVALKIYDASGRLVKTLTNDRQRAGYHTLTWKSKKPGVYFCQLKTEVKTTTKKVVVLK